MLNQYGKCSIFLTIATIYIYYIGLHSKKQGKNALSKIIKPFRTNYQFFEPVLNRAGEAASPTPMRPTRRFSSIFLSAGLCIRGDKNAKYFKQAPCRSAR